MADLPPETVPPELRPLAREVRGRSWESAKRLVVSKVGGVRRNERFDDDVADAVFLRLQRNAQVGRYASEAEVAALGRNARRLEGEGTIALYRRAPRGAGIRPGDFACDGPGETGYYAHGGHVLHRALVERADVFAVDGRLGDGREYVYLPKGYVAPEPKVHFARFGDFFAAVNEPADVPAPGPA